MTDLQLRSEDGAFLLHRIGTRKRPDAPEPWDRQWISAEAELRLGGFRASVQGDVLFDELQAFALPLSNLQRTLYGAATLKTMEPWLELQLTGDGLGHMDVECTLSQDFRATLTGRFRTDQTFTATFERGLAGIVAGLKAAPTA